MAEPGAGGEGAQGDLFTILGSVQVDRERLKKSLADAEREVRASGDRLKRIWDDVKLDPGKIPGVPIPRVPSGGGGEGEGGGGGEGGSRHSATANFAHLARLIRHTLIPALSQLAPAFGNIVSAGAQAARTAVFFGGAVGAVAIAGAAASAIIGKYVANAKEMTAANLESGQALATWDAPRAEAGLRKITEAVAEYIIQSKIASGEVEAGFWQKIVAWASVLSDKVTGALDQQIKKYKEYSDAAVKIGEQFTIPKARAEIDKSSADLLSARAALAVKNATSETSLAAAYDLSRTAIERKTAAELRANALDLEREQLTIRNMAVELRDRKATEAAAERDKELARLERSRRDEPGWFAAGGEERIGQVHKKFAQDMAAADAVVTNSNRLAADAAEANKAKVVRIEDASAKATMALRDEDTKNFARNFAEREGFYQKDVARNQKRITGEAATAEAVATSQEKVAKVQRDRLGIAESEDALEARMAATRMRATGPLIAALQSEEQSLASQLAAQDRLTEAGLAGANAAEKRAEIEAEGMARVAEIRQNLAKEEAEQDARVTEARQARVKEEYAIEGRRFAHRVAIGRASMQEEIGFQRRGMLEAPTQDLREAAEGKLFEVRRQYASQYFRYFQSLGASTWAGQLESAKSFLGELDVGSAKWYEQVQNVYGIFKGIHDEAKGIFSTQVNLAESEKQRQFHVPTAQELLGTISMREIPGLVNRARQRDEALLAGRMTEERPGDLGAAIGRMDFWKTINRESLSPEKAYGLMMQQPEERLKELVGSFTPLVTALGETGGLGKSAAAFGTAVDRFASAVDTFAGKGEAATESKPRGRSWENRGGVLRSVTDEQNKEMSTVDDNAAARNLQLADRRGPNMTESFK